MRQLTLLLVLLLLTGCAARGGAPAPAPSPAPGPAPATTPAPAPVVEPSPPAPVTPADPRPNLMVQPSRVLTRDQVRDGLLRLMEGPGEPAEKLKALMERPELRPGIWALPFAEADLDGDGAREFVLALPVRDAETPSYMNNGRLFVIYRKDGAWAVDRTDPVRDDLSLMDTFLIGVADLAGLGRPQIVWYRPWAIATGPQPYFVFVTAWQPGAFTQLPGVASISRPEKIELQGKDLVLTGISRGEWFLRTDAWPLRTDRYRYRDGGFRLVDRRFVRPTEYGYDRLWDGLVAEEVGRLADAEADYRAAAEPGRPAHSGKVPRYNTFPREILPGDMEHFGDALRTFARFRLGALLLQAGRKQEAAEVLRPAGTPYDGLTEAMAKAADRKAGCLAAAAWAAANPGYMDALNIGVGHSRWKPEWLCSHMPIEDGLLR